MQRLTFISFLIRLGVVSLLTLPTFAFAQVNSIGSIVPCSGIDCTWCSLVQMVQNLINFAIFLGVMASSLLFMYAGFLYLTNQGSTENIGKAKKIFVAVVWGIIAILAGWLIVDTIMKALVSQGGKFGFWNDFNCTTMNDNVFADTGNNNRGIVGIDDDPYSDVDGKKKPEEKSMSAKGSAGGIYSADNHDGKDARTLLSEGDVSFSRASCASDDANSDNCIDMSKVREYPVAQMMYIKKACGSDCDVVIDRGSEQVERERGQYTHITGYMLDLKRNTALDSYLIGALTKSGEQYEDACKNLYDQQTEVWRVTVWNACPL